MIPIWDALKSGTTRFLPTLFMLGVSLMMVVFARFREIKMPAKLVSFICALLIGLTAILAALAPPEAGWTVLFSLLPATLLVTFGALRFNTRQPTLPESLSPESTRSDGSAAEGAEDRGTSPSPSDRTAGPKTVEADLRPRGNSETPTPVLEEAATLRRTGLQVERRVSESFSPAIIAIQYGVPALLCAAVTSAYILVLLMPTISANGGGTHTIGLLSTVSIFRYGVAGYLVGAARLGFLGAYLATLLFIGERAIRRELTSGAAVWAVILLALGPMVSAAVATLYVSGDHVPRGADEAWQHALVFVAAGVTPKWAVGVVAEGARRLLADRVTSSANRLVPLTQLKGINSDIEARLAEEGILDARLMAMADPIVLFRNTNFPRRVLLDWIDEALLITTLGEHWPALERCGITGAIDLAAAGLETARANPGSTATTDASDIRETARAAPQLSAGAIEGSSTQTQSDTLTLLANEAGLDVLVLASVAQRFRDDAQVQLVWYLYQFEDGIPRRLTSDSSDEPS